MDVQVGKTYRHFKGNYYRVLLIAADSETPIGEKIREMVVYESLYGNHRIWVRPIDLFISKVDKDLYPDADQEYRFQLVEDYD